METHTGFVVKLLRQKKCGFIRLVDGSEDLFFHISGVTDSDGYDGLLEGVEVCFLIVENPGRDRRKAIGIVRN